VNLVLFRPDEIRRPLRPDDPRRRHLAEVLRRGVGDEFDAGVINGPRGKARIVHAGPEGWTLAFREEIPAPAADDITLLVGLPRPQTARDILRDATTLGVRTMHFVRGEKSEASYAQSSLWRDGEWERHVLTGAQQAFSTLVPEVVSGRTLAETLAALPARARRLALDNYEAGPPLDRAGLTTTEPLVLALGPERGWGPADRDALRATGFALVHLGPRVLRLETAVIAALTLAKSARGTL
jgi:16S rRNA (uracil1498-N3)-methyltransferase